MSPYPRRPYVAPTRAQLILEVCRANEEISRLRDLELHTRAWWDSAAELVRDRPIVAAAKAVVAQWSLPGPERFGLTVMLDALAEAVRARGAEPT